MVSMPIDEKVDSRPLFGGLFFQKNEKRRKNMILVEIIQIALLFFIWQKLVELVDKVKEQ